VWAEGSKEYQVKYYDDPECKEQFTNAFDEPKGLMGDCFKVNNGVATLGKRHLKVLQANDKGTKLIGWNEIKLGFAKMFAYRTTHHYQGQCSNKEFVGIVKDLSLDECSSPPLTKQFNKCAGKPATETSAAMSAESKCDKAASFISAEKYRSVIFTSAPSGHYLRIRRYLDTKCHPNLIFETRLIRVDKIEQSVRRDKDGKLGNPLCIERQTYELVQGKNGIIKAVIRSFSNSDCSGDEFEPISASISPNKPSACIASGTLGIVVESIFI
jgi:hypothetical protein